ncbi:hypothetical protein EDD11_007129 [Mortierella claussenii]|nr:hypothetical protein EDD11_007129 [Mortierella claussenii]
MRVRLVFEEPLPQYKCWYEVPRSCDTIKELQKSIRKGFRLDLYCKTTRLDLDGFFLLPGSTVAGSLKDGDLLQYVNRCGKKRSSKELEMVQSSSKKRKRTTMPNLAKPLKPVQESSQKLNAKSLNSDSTPGRDTTMADRKGAAVKNPRRRNSERHATRPNQQGLQRKINPASSNGKSYVPPAKDKLQQQIPTSIKPKRDSKDTSTLNQVLKASSTSSESSSSDTDSNDSSDSSDSSDTSDSDSDSDSDLDTPGCPTTASPLPVQPVSKAVPGGGSSKTKARNARRRLQKASSVSSRNPLEPQNLQVAPLQPVENSPGSSLQFASPSALTPPKSSTLPSTPKIIMTTVALRDVGRTVKKSKAVSMTSATQSTQDVDHRFKEHKARDIKAGDIKAVINVKLATTAKNDGPNTGETELDAPLRDYDSLPKLEGHPNVGDIIAFKTLEIGPSYTPVISDFKEAKVTKFSESEMVAEVQLDRRFRTPFETDSEGQPIMGKFDIYDEDQVERVRRGIMSLDMLSLADCRVVSK